MSRHIDTLDQREPLTKSFAGSLAFHLALAGVIGGFSILRAGAPKLGSEKGGHFGSVAVTAVSTIPLPSNNAPPNPVASDVNSNLPTPKEPPKRVAKQKTQVRPPDPKAVPIPKTYTKKEYAQAQDKFREKERDPPNQLTSPNGRQASDPMYAIQGSGKMGLGENAPFGNQFGAYAEILRNLVARQWRTSEIDPRIRTAPQVIVTFTLHRNGSATNVHIAQSSGNTALDRSGQRAILDAQPFPPLPPQFPKDQVDIDFVFELKR
jgi:protein TonB